MIEQLVRVRIEFEREPDGGYVVTSPDIPELVTEGDTWERDLGQYPRCLQ